MNSPPRGGSTRPAATPLEGERDPRRKAAHFVRPWELLLNITGQRVVDTHAQHILLYSLLLITVETSRNYLYNRQLDGEYETSPRHGDGRARPTYNSLLSPLTRRRFLIITFYWYNN